MPTPTPPSDATALVHPLPNGVRVLILPMPWLHSTCVSVYLRTGSRHEPPPLAGISHFAEHMAFKGTTTRDGRQVNLDAERLGAEVNAHTDKDHTAWHLRGRAADMPAFLAMLADIVGRPTFPADEVERERQVILQEYIEDEDDPMSIAFRLFDLACYGNHPMGTPVIGQRAAIEKISRDDLLDHVARHYGGSNLVVAIAGGIDPQLALRVATDQFGGFPAGTPTATDTPAWRGGIKVKRIGDALQSHLVLGYPVPGQLAGPDTHQLAAALFGEGMSSPLLHEIREKRGLVYYASCAADTMDDFGEFIVEASSAPGHFDEVLSETRRLLLEQAERVDEAEVDRARNQIAVRRLRQLERPARRLESAALDLFGFGYVRDPAQRLARLDGITAEDVRAAFAGMLARPAALGTAGKLKHGLAKQLETQFAAVPISLTIYILIFSSC